MAKCICPKCNSENIIPIVYGDPTPEALKAAKAGDVHLGGDDWDYDGCKMPDKFCEKCGHKWSVDHFVSKDITKVRFRYWSNWGFIDPDSMIEEQWAYEIYPDGTAKYYAYPRSSRRVLDKKAAHISPKKVDDFYNQVIWLYRPWTVIDRCEVCDGYSYELTITYKDNRKRRFHGDVGGGTVDKIIFDFLDTIPEFRDTLNS